jgi:hypothetical protein
MKTYSTEHADIATWLRLQIHEGCSRVSLRQRVGEGETHVREWPIAPEMNVEALAEEIATKVSEEGRVLRGPTLYALLGYKAGALSHFDRKLFRIEGMGGGAETLLGETEAPDGKGLVAQMMRHTEASARIGLGQTLAIVEHYKQILRERDARIAALEEKQMEVIELHEQLASLQHERNLEALREKRVEKKETFVREKLDMLTPVLMSKLLGAGVPTGQGSMFGEELLRQFLKSLAPPQIAAMTSSLSPEQTVTLHEIFQRYSDREVERQLKAAAADGTNGVRVPHDGGGEPAKDETTNGAPAHRDDPEKKENGQ